MTSNGAFQPLGNPGLIVSWLMFATAIVGVNACLLISIGTGAIEPTLPYIDGEVSISKACRQPYSRALFRTIAIALAAMGIYWWHAAGRQFGRDGRPATILGVISVLSFLLYAFVLGEADQQLTRRATVYAFLACTIGAQVLTARALRRAQRGSKPVAALLAYTYALVPVCISLTPLGGLVLGDWDRGENLAEWNTFLLMLAFFPFAGTVCHKARP